MPYQNPVNQRATQNGARNNNPQTIMHQSSSTNLPRLLPSAGPRPMPNLYAPQRSQPSHNARLAYSGVGVNSRQNGPNSLAQLSSGYPRTSQQSGHFPLSSSSCNTVVTEVRPSPIAAQYSAIQSIAAIGNAGRRYPTGPQEVPRDANLRPLMPLRSQTIRVTPGSPRMVAVPIENGSMVRLSSQQPHLQFSKCVFYDHRSKMTKPLIEPFIMCPETYTTGVKQQMSTQVTIELDDDTANAIIKCCVRDANPIEFGLQVIARFCMINPLEVNPATGMLLESVVEDCLPPHLCIAVNDQNLPLHGILLNNKLYMDGRRSPKPINVTPLLNFDIRPPNSPQRSTGRNVLRVSWVHYYPLHQYYAMGVYVAFRNTYAELARDLLASRVLSEEYMRGIMQRRLGGKLSGGDDDVIAVTNDLIISLKCPLLQSRIRLPVRTKACTHLQSFCLYNYLTMNDQKVFWKCSLCKLPAKFEDLYVDNYLQNILKNPTTAELDHVVYRPDGIWALPTSGGDESPKTDDYSPISSRTIDKKPVVTSPCKLPVPRSTPNIAEELVIDLISSDEEDESSTAPSNACMSAEVHGNSANQPNDVIGVNQTTANGTSDNNNHSKRKSTDLPGLTSPAEKRPCLSPGGELIESSAHAEQPAIASALSSAPTENVFIVISDSDNDDEDKDAPRSDETQSEITAKSVANSSSNSAERPEPSLPLSPVVSKTSVTSMSIATNVSASVVSTSMSSLCGDVTPPHRVPNFPGVPLSTVTSTECNGVQPLFTSVNNSMSSVTTTTTSPHIVGAAQSTMPEVTSPTRTLFRPLLFSELAARNRNSSWVADSRRTDMAHSAVTAVGMIPRRQRQ